MQNEDLSAEDKTIEALKGRYPDLSEHQISVVSEFTLLEQDGAVEAILDLGLDPDDPNLTKALVLEKIEEINTLWFEEKRYSEKQRHILSSFPLSMRQYAEIYLRQIPESTLSESSVQALVDEIRFMGGLSNNVINIARENHDVRERLKSSRKLVLLLATFLIILGVIVAILISLFSIYPKYKTVQTIDNSAICEINPNENPAFSVPSIEDFAKEAILNTYAYDFINWQRQINDATDRYFVPEGRSSFKSALRNSQSLKHIIANNLTMKSSSISSPQLTNKSTDRFGKPYWIVKMPISVEFYASKTKPDDVQNLLAEVKIVTTVRDAKNPKGLGVATVVLKPYRN